MECKVDIKLENPTIKILIPESDLELVKTLIGRGENFKLCISEDRN